MENYSLTYIQIAIIAHTTILKGLALLSFFKQYLPYYKEYKLQFAFAFFGMLLVAASSSAIAYLVKPVLDEIFINKDLSMLAILPYLVVIAYLAKGGGAFVQAYYISYIGKDIVRRVRDKLLGHVLTLDLDFFYKMRSGELISRLLGDIGRIQSAASSHFATFIREIMTIIGLVGVVIYQSPMLAFYGLVVIPLAFYPLSLLAQRMKKISYRSQESAGNMTSSLTEIFNNIEIIKAKNSQKFEGERFAKHGMEFFKIDMKSVKINEAVNPLMEALGSIAAAVVIVIGGNEVIEGKMSVGAFFSFMAALFMLYTPIRQLSSIYNKIQDAVAANERINQIFDLSPNITGGTHIAPTTINTIEFKGVSLSYDEKPALKNIEFHAKKGELIALVGNSGGGKSSFVNLILRFFEPRSGHILLDGQNIGEFDLKSLRERISIVTQRVYIFNDTVAQNVAYGSELDRERVTQALKLAHAFDFVSAMPQGIDTTLDEFGTNLSGGQRQRIAIARAIYTNPEILIFDEATSALDNVSEQAITEAISEISKQKMVFVVAHRLSTIKNATKIAVFKEGKILCIGSESELLSGCPEFRNLKDLS